MTNVAVGVGISPGGVVVALSSLDNFKEDLWKLQESKGQTDKQKSKDKNNLPEQAGRGQSKGGRHTQETLQEELAMEEVMKSPQKGRELKGKNTDPRWPAKDGWEKWIQNVNGHEIHYQYNPRTGLIDDVKFKRRKNMKVKCIANTGAGFSEYTMEHMGCSVETQLPLCIDEIYIVYGQMIYRGMLQYLIKGTYENLPSWYPAEIFDTIDSLLPFEWYFCFRREDETSAIWGFDELVNDEQYIDSLIDREDEAVRTFLKRKKEIDEFSE